MADNVVIYLVIHQPWRLRLPVQPLPANLSPEGLSARLFDDALNQRYFRKVAQTCYYPASEMFQSLVERGLRVSMGFTVSFLEQAARYDPALLDRFRRLVSHPNVEPVCIEPYHSLLFFVDVQRFQQRMIWARRHLGEIFGKEPQTAGATELFMSNEIYRAFQRAGFRTAVMEGATQVLNGAPGTFAHRPEEDGPTLFLRHRGLSDDVGYRFSQRSWNRYPLTAQTYAEWLKGTGGDVILLGWDFETFGEHHWASTGIFDFLKWFAGELAWRGIEPLTFSQATDRFGSRSRPLQLPAAPVTWAGTDGDAKFFLGNQAQFRCLLLMKHAYNLALQSGDPKLEDIALRLCQSDHMHFLQWIDSGYRSDAEVSFYFMPDSWRNMGVNQVPVEIERAYQQVIGYMSGALTAASENNMHLRKRKRKNGRKPSFVGDALPISLAVSSMPPGVSA